ncbi:hypothetical protein T492DRAFT_129477 [Pavlovales sp. CCMP2436]|nr:hypothetical protein T492DRAFT_129477 [Pavlovales sp. CCMP2436]
MGWESSRRASSDGYDARSRELFDSLSPPEREAVEALARHLSPRPAARGGEREQRASRPRMAEELLRGSILRLAGAGLTDEHAPAIAALLRRAPSLSALNLTRNSLTDASCELIAKALPYARELESLDLSDNRIGPSGLEALAPGLAMCPRLSHLALDGNNWRAAGLQWAEASWQRHVIKMLSLSPKSPADGKLRQRVGVWKKKGRKIRANWMQAHLYADLYADLAEGEEAEEFAEFTWLHLGSYPPDEASSLFAVALLFARADDAFAAQHLAAGVLRLHSPVDRCVGLVTALFDYDPPRAIRFGVLLAKEVLFLFLFLYIVVAVMFVNDEVRIGVQV